MADLLRRRRVVLGGFCTSFTVGVASPVYSTLLTVSRRAGLGSHQRLRGVRQLVRPTSAAGPLRIRHLVDWECSIVPRNDQRSHLWEAVRRWLPQALAVRRDPSLHRRTLRPLVRHLLRSHFSRSRCSMRSESFVQPRFSSWRRTVQSRSYELAPQMRVVMSRLAGLGLSPILFAWM